MGSTGSTAKPKVDFEKLDLYAVLQVSNNATNEELKVFIAIFLTCYLILIIWKHVLFRLLIVKELLNTIQIKIKVTLKARLGDLHASNTRTR